MTADIPKDDYEFVQKIAYKYFLRSNYYVELDDLVQEGMLAYIKEREKYDETRNNFFMGYAYLRVSGAIKDYIGKNSPRGGATVRPNSSVVNKEVYNFSSIGLDENDFEDTFSLTVEDEIVKQQYFEEFYRYLGTLTNLETRVLYEYFILQNSVVKISERVKMSRIKLKKILNACLYHMKSYFQIDDYIV
jgi:RNA polymerase sigma factor (sigma-70 family)